MSPVICELFCTHIITSLLYEKTFLKNISVKLQLNSVSLIFSAIKPELLSALSEECESLYRENFSDEDNSIHFPVSLTPFKSYTEHLLANNRKLLRRRTRKILSQDFSQDRIDFAGNHKWLVI